MNLGLTDKVAVVTGTGRGIGDAVCRELIAEGCRVVSLSRSENVFLGQHAAGVGVEFLHYSVDIADEEQVQVAIVEALKQFGQIDILVNNAGMTDDGLLIKESLSEWDRMLAVNLTGPRNCLKAVLPAMIKQKQGSIVNIGSVAGLTGSAGQGSYVASKAGLLGLTMVVAKEYGRRGIRCNIVCPGYIETDMTRDLKSEQIEQMIAATPLGRAGCVVDIVPTVIMLCSNRTRFTTGSLVVIDGGMTMHL